MIDKYYVIHNSDGNTTVIEYTKEELEKWMNDIAKYEVTPIKTFDAIPTEKDTNYWYNKYLIIKGNIVEPKRVVTVTKYEI